MTPSDEPPREYDSPWKDTLDQFLSECLALLFLWLHREIDWAVPVENLNTELSALAREGELGRTEADRLYRVRGKTLGDAAVLIHVEVQAQADAAFAARMCDYYTRIYDHYRVPVISAAILADDNPNWLPRRYIRSCLKCRLTLDFPVVKLLKFQKRMKWLEQSANPVALVVAAHLESQAARHDPDARMKAKWRLFRRLYDLGFDAERMRQLFRLIDWLLALPEGLEEQLRTQVREYEESRGMPYIPTYERAAHEAGLELGKEQGLELGKELGQKVGRRKGLTQGRLSGLKNGLAVALKVKFGPAGTQLAGELEKVKSVTKLEAILAAVESTRSIDELRRRFDR